MTKQVEFFEANKINDLQFLVNRLLKAIETYDFIDVKYNHILLNHTTIRYTAMVVYNKDEYPESVPEGKTGIAPIPAGGIEGL